MNIQLDKAKIVYLAIILSLLVHIVVLLVFYLTPLNRQSDNALDEVEVETVDREQVPDLEELLELHQEEGPEVRNVIANRQSEQSQEVRSYNRMSEEQMQEEINERLKNLEQQTIEEQRKQGKGFDEEKFQQEKVEESEIEEDYSYINKNETSYSNATVEYDLADRDALKLEVPAYTCMGSGVVVIDIDVDREGNIVSTSINEAQTRTSQECHREQALKFAQERSLFYNKIDAPRRQSGTITYRFLAQ
ncbi:hypothetical protein [Halocola ammonii]